MFTDDDLAGLQRILIENPEVGDRIQGGRGLRKLRVPMPGRGKRGGARVIYYYWTGQCQCYLIYAYAKNAAGDLTKDQRLRLADVMDTEVRDG